MRCKITYTLWISTSPTHQSPSVLSSHPSPPPISTIPGRKRAKHADISSQIPEQEREQYMFLPFYLTISGNLVRNTEIVSSFPILFRPLCSRGGFIMRKRMLVFRTLLQTAHQHGISTLRGRTRRDSEKGQRRFLSLLPSQELLPPEAERGRE